MARIRTIKPDFFYDEELAALPIAVRLFFIGMWLYADREGRLEDSPRRLKAQILPYDDIDGEEAISSLAEHFIIRYESGGRRYIQIKNFLKHQMPHYKELPSTIPKPEGHQDSGYNAEPIRAEDKEFVYKRDGGKCRSCGTDKNLSIDHIKPRVHGGGSDRDNLQILCRDCNSSKSANGERRMRRLSTNVESTLHPGREGNGREVVGKGLEGIKHPGQGPIDLKKLAQEKTFAGDFWTYRLPANFGSYGNRLLVDIPADECLFMIQTMNPGPKVKAALQWRVEQKAQECKR